MEIIISVGLFVVGAALGSFACCQAWRLRNGDRSTRSHCMKCGYRLKWYDELPVVSWLVLRGRCRKCGGKIGVAEILSEVGLGVAFAGAYWLWPEAVGGASETLWNWGLFAVFLVSLVGLLVLFIYDLRWRELPQAVLTFCVVCATMFISLRLWWLVSVSEFSWGAVWSLAGALVILPVVYFVLYKVSREQWMGGGDWWVALCCALLLMDWWLALLCVFVANMLGSVIGLALMRKRKGNRKMKLAFVPFLIVAMLVVFFAQDILLKLI